MKAAGTGGRNAGDPVAKRGREVGGGRTEPGSGSPRRGGEEGWGAGGRVPLDPPFLPGHGRARSAPKCRPAAGIPALPLLPSLPGQRPLVKSQPSNACFASPSTMERPFLYRIVKLAE